jgi:tetratricopeptide (TPR) repeat protein
MHDELLARAQRLERFAQMDPGNQALRLDLARTYHLAGEHAAALGVLDGAGPEAKQGRPLPLRGELLLALGRWEEAIAFYRQAGESEPGSGAIAFNLAYATWASGAEPEQTIALFRAAVKLDPANARAWRLLATVLSDAGETLSAVQTIEQVLTQWPDDAETLRLAAQLYLDAGQLEKAARYADRSVAAAPADAEAWAIKGNVALFSLDAAAAWKSLRQAVDLAPKDVDARVSLAQAALMQGRARHARDVLEAALALEPGNASALCMTAWACLADDDNAAAAAAFQRAATEEPDNADAWAGTALIALGAGDAAHAGSASDRALELDAQHPIATLVRARLQETGGRPEDAKALFESVLGHRPGGPVTASLGGMLASAPAQKLLQRQQRRLERMVQARTRQH